MEEPGVIIKKPGRVKFSTLVLPSFFLLLVIIGILTFNQEKKMETRSSIKGILQNKAGSPVADAVVMIKEGSHEFNDIASVSNSNGEFFVSGIVIPGRYVLQIQLANDTITQAINVQSADTIIRINF